MQIKIDKLNYWYEVEKVLKDIDLEVNAKDFIGIIGHTGSGKSTLLKHLNVILKPIQGKVQIFDRVIQKNSKNLNEIRKRVGVVFQFPEEQLFSQTSKEDILFGPKNFNIPQDEIDKNFDIIKETLNLTDEILNKPATELSGGEKRRVSIASIMVSNPDILVLDEPTIGLDYENKINLLNFLDKINKLGKTIIVVSHDLHFIWEHLKRIVLLEKGIKIFDGDKVSLLKERSIIGENRVYLPDYIEILEKYNLLEGNEEKIKDKNSAIEILVNSLREEL